MDIGPNMRRLRECSVGDSLQACLLAGPADLLTWEVHVGCEADGVPVEIVGRGTDLESAAAEALSQLTTNSLATFGHPEIGVTE